MQKIYIMFIHILRNCIITFLLLVLPFTLLAQSHWESIVLAGESWKYLPATSEPSAFWNQATFDDTAWKQGLGGIGLGDGDDATVISACNSVYLRRKLTINDIQIIEKVILDIDFDDAFVLYINGKEVSRSFNITAKPVLYNSTLTADHEALIYRGFSPERYELKTTDFVQGENLIAVQILNNGISSSDLSAMVWLNGLIKSTSTVYNAVPAWFKAPVSYGESNLPIVIITTDINPNTSQPIEIVDDPKVLANMKIIYHQDGSRNYLTDQSNASLLNYNGRIGIEFRGSSSQALPKKPYGFETLQADNITNNNVSLLGMPKENDWILNALAFDPSLIRDFLSYEISRSMGNYAARGNYCEVYINGDYKGLYVLMEKPKVDTERINVYKMLPADISGDALTGGYVTKSDKTTGGDPVAWTMLSVNNWAVSFIHDYPKPEEITAQQNTYIYNQFMALKNVMTAQNSSITNGYPSIIDIPSFVDFILLNELSSNADGYHYSTYYHKDKNGKLRAGPVWDFNLTYGNDLFDWNLDRSKYDVWQFNNSDNTGPKYWLDLFQNPTFNCYLSKRWTELIVAGKPFSYTNIANRIDQLVSLLTEAQVRENNRWSTVGNFTSNISALKTWLQNRINWMNARLNNYQACANIVLPKLVISKINYNPVAIGLNVSDNLEYIEITNNSNVTVNLTGFYLRELGISYQFQANSTIAANTRIYIASNSATFTQVYGFSPFGQFTRNLSNKTQNLVLADAYGNVIDNVAYTDSAPWYPEADGKGAYLELIDLNADNSLAASWRPSNQLIGEIDSNSSSSVRIFPIPTHKDLHIISPESQMKSYQITDLLGRIVVNEQKYDIKPDVINVENLSNNFYLIKLNFLNGTTITRKFVKQ